MDQKIEILSVSLLEQHHSLVNELRHLASTLGLELGWHYLLDLIWIISHLPTSFQPSDSLGLRGSLYRGQTFLDAGAGVGLLQWYLAEQGANVLSVDRLDRSDLPLRFRGRYSIKGLRPEDLHPTWVSFLKIGDNGGVKGWLSGVAYYGVGKLQQFWQRIRGRYSPGGTVILYHQDLALLDELPSDSMEAVVAVSALEHNSPENLSQVVEELMRVLKPGGYLLATLGAARDEDWFHEPSQGWCYTADSLRRHFSLPSDTPDNYACYDALMASLRDCAELRDNLARFYFQCGDNGMPWGKWDPQYQPVGVCKVK